MPNYKEMYLTMFRAAEQAVRILQEAQLKCEELYMGDDVLLTLLPKKDDGHKTE